MSRLAVVAGCLAAAVSPADAQADSAPANAPAPRRFCFNAAAAPRCRNFFLTELAGGILIASSSHAGQNFTRKDFKSEAFFTLGVLHNSAPTTATGASIVFSSAGRGLGQFEGVDLRRRHWLGSPGRAIDYSAGYARQRYGVPVGGDQFQRVAHGGSASAGFSFNNYVGVFARADLLRSQDGFRGAAFAGGDVGSGAVPVAAVITAFAAGVLYLLILSTHPK